MSYYDELFRKIPTIKKFLDSDDGCIIYHYTKPEKLLNIISNNTLRFSNALYLNDKEEIAYSYKLIVKLIDEVDGLNHDLFDKIKNHFKNKYKNIVDGENEFNNKIEYYTTSFSTESDNLTLWNNYAKGKSYTGYNIGFDKNLLLKEMATNGYIPISGKVIYDKQKQIKMIKTIFKKWNKLFERASNSKKVNEVKLFDILFELIDILSIISIFFKNPQFRNEHEYRLVILNIFGDSKSKPTNVVEKNGLFVPYLEYKFSKDSLVSINIGPTFDENIFYTSTNRMLLNYGYINKTVNRSKIPLRY